MARRAVSKHTAGPSGHFGYSYNRRIRFCPRSGGSRAGSGNLSAAWLVLIARRRRRRPRACRCARSLAYEMNTGAEVAVQSAAARAAGSARSALGGRVLSVSFLARLSAALCPMGTFVLVTHLRGIGQVGLVAGALWIGQALGGPFIGRRADVSGHRPVIVAASAVNAAAIPALVGCVLAPAPLVGLLAASWAVGLSTPAVGAEPGRLRACDRRSRLCCRTTPDRGLQPRRARRPR